MRRWIFLIFQAEQHEVSGVTGWKTGNLQVVVHPAIGLRQRIVLPGEELLLIVVAGPPGQNGADVERFTQDLTHHVFGQHAFRRILIVRAAGGVNVVVAGKPAQTWRVSSSFWGGMASARPRM